MSKKTPQPQPSPQPGGGGSVDFLVRTMIERESTGKRRIRPKNVEELLQSVPQDESDDDPDFDYNEEDSVSEGTVESDESSDSSDSDNNEDKGENGDNSDESDDEDYKAKEGSSSGDNAESEVDTDSSEDESESESDGAEGAKKSALRETLQKLNETNDFLSKRPAKKKRKKKSGDKQGVKSSKTTKSKSSKIKPTESSGKSNKISKSKKVIGAKKSKSSKKLMSESKKRKKEKKAEERHKTKKRSIGRLVQEADVHQKENRNKMMDVSKPVCSYCLGDKSDDSNEIVECDSCGISVHEVCFDLFYSDNASISSGSGSSSCTEPWFCDACKSDPVNNNISCELCPVQGGLYKETTAGRWVHLICAVYTQGVVVLHGSKVDLYGIQYSRWGSHNCTACENEREAQTGIVIECDAGMCKTYFHATCAQKHGLLSDPNQADHEVAFPYYVSCKLHTNREIMKRRIKLFNTLQEQLRIKTERKELEGLPSGSNVDQARIFRKLNKAREKTAHKQAEYLKSLENVPPQDNNSSSDQSGNALPHLPPTWLNGNKKQRLLHTAAKLSSNFLRKTELLGDNIGALELEVKHEKIISNVKRKWNVQPAMSVEYSAYYADREHRITSMMEQYDNAVQDNQKLMEKGVSVQDNLETQEVNLMAMEEETGDVSKKLKSLADILQSLCPVDKILSTKLQLLVKPKELAGGRRKSPSMSRGDRKSPTPRRSSTSKKSQKGRLQSPSPSRAGKMTIAVCDTCSKRDNQPWITRCDKCRKHYHLSCLDPPLTRMPKRTRLCGWMCSDCCDPPSEEDDEVDTEAPRTLRGRTKIHKPRKYRGSDESEDESHNNKSQTESDVKTVAKKVKSIPNSLSSPETSSFLDPLPVNASPQKNTPSDRRRRSGSASLPLSSPVLDTNTPVVNGPTMKSPSSGKAAGRGKLGLQSEPGTVEDVSLEDVKPKKTKSKKSTTPKGPKQQSQAETSPSTKKKSTKRKSSDGPLTSFKVNGLSDASIPKLESSDKVVVKQKRSKKRKSETPVIGTATAIGNEMLSNESIQAIVSVPNPNIGKPKKPRKKKEHRDDLETSSSVSPKQENILAKVGKAKKPRKKKELNINGVLQTESDVTSASNVVKKKGRKKAKTVVLPAVLGDEGTLGDNIASCMEMVTSHVLESKVKNGALKTSKKRKNSTLLSSPSAEVGNNSASVTVADSLPEVKEKSVPPKKRKRAPSIAQLQQQAVQSNTSVDNIIKAVSTGNFQGAILENGDRELSSNGLSAIMQTQNPPNRQLSSGHLMQGKAMGSGVNLGEMVTVDASFLIDGAGESSYGQNSVSTFYSSNQSRSAVVPDNNGGVSFQIPSTNNSDNVIRLQYIDQGDVTPALIPDSVAMPPPAVSSLPNSNLLPESTEVCATCTKSGDKTQLVMCDKCQFEYHFTCLDPPLKYSPRRKGNPWFCKHCKESDGEAHENGVARNQK